MDRTHDGPNLDAVSRDSARAHLGMALVVRNLTHATGTGLPTRTSGPRPAGTCHIDDRNRPVLTRPPGSSSLSPRARAGMATANSASQDRPPAPCPRAPRHACTCNTHGTFLSHDTRDRTTPWRMEHSSSPELLFGTLCLALPLDAKMAPHPRRSHLHASPSPLPKV